MLSFRSNLWLVVVPALLVAGCPSDDDAKDCQGIECRDTDVSPTDVTDDTDESDPVVTDETDKPIETAVEETDPTDDTETDDTDDTVPVETDTDTDTGVHTDTDTDTETSVDTDTDTDGPPPKDFNALRHGDVVITEIMVKPLNCQNGQQGQFLELKNMLDERINLRNMVVTYGARSKTINIDIYVEAGAYFIGRADIPTQCAGYAGALTADFTYSSLVTFSEGATTSVSVSNVHHITIDSISYAPWRFGQPPDIFRESYSVHLLPDQEDAVLNDDPLSWCLADTAFGAFNFASPRQRATGCTVIVDPPTCSDLCPGAQCPADCCPDPCIGAECPAWCEQDPDPNGPKTVNQLDVNDLVITELLLRPEECVSASDGRYFEITNTTDVPVDIRDLRFDWGTVTNLRITKRTNTTWMVAPGESVAIQYSGQSSCYTYSPRFRMNYPLDATGRLLRIKGTDATRPPINEVNFSAFTIPAGRAVGFDPAALDTEPGLNVLRSQWCAQRTTITGAVRDLGTPSSRNDACFTEGGGDTDPYVGDSDARLCREDPTRNPNNGLDVDELCPGDVLITEVHLSPTDCRGDLPGGQYIELYNRSGVEIRPAGLLVDTGTALAQPVLTLPGASGTVAPGEFFTVHPAFFGSYCHSFTKKFSLQQSGIFFAAGQIRIATDTWSLDTVDVSNWTLEAGKARQVSASVPLGLVTDEDLDEESLWCTTGPEMLPAGSADRGTPTVQSNCASGVVEPPIDTGETDACAARTTANGLSVEEICEGELVITEALVKPQGCGGGNNAKYFEVYNKSAFPMNLDGLKVAVDGSATGVIHVVQGGTDTLLSGAYGVVRVGTAASFCFSTVTPNWQLDYASLSAAPLRVFSNAVSVIDRVDLSQQQMFRGYGSLFDPDSPPDAVANNEPSDWCHAADRIGTSEDFGSPGYRGACGAPDTAGDIVVEPGNTPLVLTDVPAGGLVITEFMAAAVCEDNDAEYIEVWNSLERPIDLAGLRLQVNSSGVSTLITTSTILAPNAYATLARYTTNSRCFLSNPTMFYPLPRSQAAQFNLGDTNNTIRISSTARTLDEVLTGQWAVQPEGRAMQLRADSFTSAASVQNNFEAMWCPTPAIDLYRLPGRSAVQRDYGTPGKPNDGCAVEDTETGIDTSGIDSDTSLIDTDPVLEYDKEVAELPAGSIIVSEFMAQPSECSPESTAEYIEVYNTTAFRVNLRGLVITDEDGTTAMNFQTVIAPHGYATLVNVMAGSAQCYGLSGATVGRYAGALLDNDGDVIRLTAGATVQDTVDFNDFSPLYGAAYELADTALTSVANDSKGAWCRASRSVTPGGRDLGSPGVANLCDPLRDAAITYPEADRKGLDELVAGDLLVSEFMAATSEPGCLDGSAEWIELYNNSGQTVNLRGLSIANRTGDSSATRIWDDVWVGPGKFAVLARGNNEGRCYNPKVAAFYASLNLENSGDKIRLLARTLLIDEVDFRTWPAVVRGQSKQLSGGSLSPSLNDVPLYWCEGRSSIDVASTDLGTPGGPNFVCPALVAGGETDTACEVDSDEAPPVGYVDTDPAPGGSPLTLAQLSVGDLIVNELMVDPRDCKDECAEYIELYNRRNASVNLRGLLIQTSTGVFTLNQDVIVGPFNHILAMPATGNGYDVPVDFTYTGLRFRNDGERVFLFSGSLILDSILTTNFPRQISGASWILDPEARHAGVAPSFTNWCASQSRIPGGFGDLGTPGYVNDQCVTDYETDLRDTSETGAKFDEDPKPLTDVRVGELLITEIMADPRDCDDGRAEYVEIYNNSDTPISLEGLTISDGTRTSTLDLARRAIGPRSYKVIRRESNQPCYDLPTTMKYASVLLGNERKLVAIASPVRVIDVVDWTSFPAAPGKAYTLNPTLVGTRPPLGIAGQTLSSMLTNGVGGYYLNADPAGWCAAYFRLPGATGDKGSPGVANDRCLGPGEPVPYPPDYVANVDELEAGDLAITEFMVDPVACSDVFCEYVEFVNTSSFKVDLFGLFVRTEAQASVVSTHLIVSPDQRVLVRKTSGATYYAGVNGDVLVPSIQLANDGDRLVLANVHSELDVVDYTRFSVAPGRAFSVQAAFEDAVGNDDESVWCFEFDRIAGTLDQGSPGQPIGTCDEPAVVKNVDELAVGDVIISEVMLTSVECFSGPDNYFEVTNTTADNVDLVGMRLFIHGGSPDLSNATPVVIDQHVVVPPGGQALLLRQGQGCVMSYITHLGDFLYTYPTLLFTGERVSLARDGSRTAGSILDQIDTTQLPTLWETDREGVSLQVKPDQLTAAANDSIANWCPAYVRVRGTEQGGTPGKPNDCVTDNLDDPRLDTGIDTDLPDTDLYELAVVFGDADVNPLSYYRGREQRVVAVGNLHVWDIVGPSPARGALCWGGWDANQVGARLPVGPGSLCPDCDWGWEVRFANRDDIGNNDLNDPSDWTACETIFAGVGGVKQLPPRRRMYGSSVDGLLYWVGPSGNLETFTDVVDFYPDGVSYKKYVYKYAY